MPFTERVRTAHGDAWELDGALRAGAARITGARLSCSGLPFEQWNAATLTSLPVDIEAARRWYAERKCPWGMAVPVEYELEPGQYLFTRSCMGLEPQWFQPAAAPRDVVLRLANTGDLETFCALDVAIFGGRLEDTRAWITPMFEAPAFRHWLGLVDDQAVAIGTARRTDSEAGPCGTLSGIGVLAPFRRRGIAGALTTFASAWLFGAGATLLHLDPHDDRAARVYQRLGFREAPGFRVYRMS
jgi:ribosomal protein S18 acetylase RimI-like enzyme